MIAVKAPSLADAAEAARPMIGPATLIVPMLNGVPWWFTGEPLDSVDPGRPDRGGACRPSKSSAASSMPRAAGPRPTMWWSSMPTSSSSASRGRQRASASSGLRRCSSAPGIRTEAQRQCAPRDLVQIVGQCDDQSAVGADPLDRRRLLAEPANARLDARRDGRARRGRRRDRLPDQRERRGPDGGHRAARRVQDVDAAGCRGRPPDRARGAARRAARNRRAAPASPTPQLDRSTR